MSILLAREELIKFGKFRTKGSALFGNNDTAAEVCAIPTAVHSCFADSFYAVSFRLRKVHRLKHEQLLLLERICL